ncbi:lipopolysaccharide biosynthesis protein [Fulvivirga ligni]|uniref:lipopolysaccharide biosynthesis protein n=1 Tax=Fulvivirga ligni TaxID=2904246 RepID=UPI001F23FCB0|nr:hypothetical protein [Fulvivirga ligni]UII21330.1 hypothetical protein LVD16_26210 [Fulvivirga ligni]
MISFSKILRNDKLIVVANQMTVSGTTFLTNIMIATIAGISVFGTFSAWQISLLLVLAFQMAVIGQPMQVFIGRKDKEELKSYSASVHWLQIIFLTSAAFIFISFSLITQYFSISITLSFLAYGFFYLFQEHFRRYLIARGQLVTTFISDAISSGGQLLVLGLLWWNNITPTLEILFLTIGLTTVPAVLFIIIKERNVFKQKFYLTKYIKEHWQNARWLVPTALIQWGASNYLLAASAVIAGSTVLGVLRLAQTAMGIFNIAIQGLENYLLPYMSKLITGGTDSALDFTFRMIKKISLLTAPILILAALMAEPILELVNTEYTQYASLLRWCCLLYIIILSSFPVKLFIRVLGDSRHYFIGYAISLAVSVLTAQWLISHWEAVGVVMGWLLSQLLINVYWTIIITKTKQLSWTLK